MGQSNFSITNTLFPCFQGVFGTRSTGFLLVAWFVLFVLLDNCPNCLTGFCAGLTRYIPATAGMAPHSVSHHRAALEPVSPPAAPPEPLIAEAAIFEATPVCQEPEELIPAAEIPAVESAPRTEEHKSLIWKYFPESPRRNK